MNKLFVKPSRHFLFSVVLLTGLSACGEQRGSIIPPTANDALHAMRQQDDSIIQLKLLKCLRSNPFEGQVGNQSRYDLYECQVLVERYDPLLDQSFSQQQKVILNLSSSGWETN